jgi:hypothetical protein
MIIILLQTLRYHKKQKIASTYPMLRGRWSREVEREESVDAREEADLQAEKRLQRQALQAQAALAQQDILDKEQSARAVKIKQLRKRQMQKATRARLMSQLLRLKRKDAKSKRRQALLAMRRGGRLGSWFAHEASNLSVPRSASPRQLLDWFSAKRVDNGITSGKEPVAEPSEAPPHNTALGGLSSLRGPRRWRRYRRRRMSRRRKPKQNILGLQGSCYIRDSLATHLTWHSCVTMRVCVFEVFGRDRKRWGEGFKRIY